MPALFVERPCKPDVRDDDRPPPGPLLLDKVHQVLSEGSVQRRRISRARPRLMENIDAGIAQLGPKGPLGRRLAGEAVCQGSGSSVSLPSPFGPF
jgi:hypothetical protein